MTFPFLFLSDKSSLYQNNHSSFSCFLVFLVSFVSQLSFLNVSSVNSHHTQRLGDLGLAFPLAVTLSSPSL